MMAEDSARESNENLISSTSKSGEQSANEKKLNEIQAAMEAYEDQKVREGVEDVEEAMKEYAKKQITEATSNTDLIMKAEILIQEDWLGKTDELPGNIYCLMAFGDVMASGSACLSTEGMLAVAKLLGWVLIVLIQLVGPVMMFFSSVRGVGVLEEKMWLWRCAKWTQYVPFLFQKGDHYEEGSDEPCGYTPHGSDDALMPDDVSMLLDWYHISTTKILGLLIIVAFILNGIFVINGEMETWKKIYNTFRFLKENTPNFDVKGRWGLILGVCVNCWVVVWCCLDSYIVIGASETPSDLVKDALALLFLYNLDDIGGDLGFFSSDDWPGVRVAWIYDEIVHPCPDEFFDESVLDWPGYISLSIYKYTTGALLVLLFILPFLDTITPFIAVVPAD